jgi:hypothetical protein
VIESSSLYEAFGNMRERRLSLAWLLLKESHQILLLREAKAYVNLNSEMTSSGSD